MRFNYKIFIGLVIIFSSCKHDAETSVEEVPVLRASNIYKGDSIINYLKKYKDSHLEIATSYFKKGLDLEGTDHSKSSFYIKRAITLYPTFNYYKELALLSYKNGDYKEMYLAYDLLETEMYDTNDNELFHFIKKDIPDIVYEHFIALLLRDNGIFVNYIDEVVDIDAQKMGITLKEFKNKVISDKRLKLDTNSEVCRNLILNFLTEKEIID